MTYHNLRGGLLATEVGKVRKVGKVSQILKKSRNLTVERLLDLALKCILKYSVNKSANKK